MYGNSTILWGRGYSYPHFTDGKKKSKYREFMSPTVKKLLLTTSNTKIFFKKSVYFSYSFVLMKPYYTTSFKKFIWLHQVFTGACGIQFPDWRLKPRPPGLWAQSFSYWTTREVLYYIFYIFIIYGMKIRKCRLWTCSSPHGLPPAL